jgi:hypothetical protein
MNQPFKKGGTLCASFLLLGILHYFMAAFCNKWTDGFTILRIHSELPFNPAWESTPISNEKRNELHDIFSQKFHYLASGGQCFAFASENERYVVKFFKHKFRKPYSYFLKIPLPEKLDQLRKRKLNKALYKLKRDFTSYKIAYEELPQETRLLYIHLNKGTQLNQSITIIDKLGIEHLIPLDDVEFIVQAKAELVYAHIETLMKQGDTQGVREALHSILHIIVNRCKRGIFDEDPRIHRNFGFIGNTPIFIDVGRFVRDPTRRDPIVYKADLLTITKRFRAWLKESHPKLVPILEEELNAFEVNF